VFQTRARRHRIVAHTSFLVIIAASAILLGLGFAQPASAALIGVSLGYDGAVRDGATTGVETHFASPVFPPSPATLPATNPPLPPPLLPARDLTSTMTEFLGAFNGDFVQHVVITIQAQNPALSAFANPIDNTLPLPVQFDGKFYSNNLPAGQMIDLKGTGIEDGNDISPFPVPGSVMTSGAGTQADPWRVQIGIPGNLVNVNNGFVKVHLYYDTKPLIPEPSTGTLLLAGVAALARGIRPRRR
jgi:hypothetical protein